MSGTVSFEPLSPLSLLERSAAVYPDKTAVVHGDKHYTYAQFHERVCRLSSALRQAGVEKGDRVAFLVPNLPAMLEGHFGPLRAGAILVAINIRLSAREIAYIINHSGAKVLVFDTEFAPVVRQVRPDTPGVSLFVHVDDGFGMAPDIPGPDYEMFLEMGSPSEPKVPLDSEMDTIAINYTSGTTGLPKGVMYHARGAYLAAISEVLEMGITWRSTYLWTLPMFHCNGWCFTWGVAAVGGTNVCLRRIDPDTIFDVIESEGVTHMCGAPTVLTMMYSSPAAEGRDLSGLFIVTAGAPPAPLVIRTIEGMGAYIQHAYGLTETYGPHTLCADQPGWDELPVEKRAKLKSRQGVPYLMADPGLRVVDSHMNDVPKDAETMGEVVMRGNNVMSGYFDDTAASEMAFQGDWFHSGDLGVWHPDGYIELKDRAKDVIISGGENISTQEVERVVMDHPAVLEVSVVGVPDDRWGETPKAFITTRPDAEVTEKEIIDFCRDRIAHFKAPKHVEFGDLPKTATGKIQKFVLREREWAGQEKRIH